MFTLTSQDRHGILCIDDTQGFDGVRFYKDQAPTLRAKRSGLKVAKENQIMQIGMLDIKGNEQIRRVYGEEGISPTLNSMQGGNRQPKILTVGRLNSSQDGIVVSDKGISPTHTSGHGNTPKVMVKEATKKGYAIAEEGDSINLEQPNSKTRRGRVGKQVAQTLTCSCNQATLIPNKNRSELYNLLLIATVINDIVNLEGVDYIEDEKRKSKEILQILWKINGTKKVFNREIRRTLSLQEKSILRQRVHEKGLFKYRTKRIKLEQFTYNGKENSKREYTDKTMRDLWENFKTRCSPQRWGLSEQQIREFYDVIDRKSTRLNSSHSGESRMPSSA